MKTTVTLFAEKNKRKHKMEKKAQDAIWDAWRKNDAASGRADHVNERTMLDCTRALDSSISIGWGKNDGMPPLALRLGLNKFVLYRSSY